MIRGFKRLAILLGVCSTLLALVVYLIGDRGKRSFGTTLTPLPPVDTVVSEARRLAGVPYDPLMGMHGDIGGRLGFIVCSDVPHIAFLLHSTSFQTLLDEDLLDEDPRA